MCFFFQAEDGIRDVAVTGVQTCALPHPARRRADLARRGGRRRGHQHPLRGGQARHRLLAGARAPGHLVRGRELGGGAHAVGLLLVAAAALRRRADPRAVAPLPPRGRRSRTLGPPVATESVRAATLPGGPRLSRGARGGTLLAAAFALLGAALPAAPARAAEVEVEVEGIRGDLRENVRNALSIARADDPSADRVRALHAQAGTEIQEA